MQSFQVRWQDFRDGKFTQDCSSIELIRNGSDEVTYQGPGELWQEEGTLFFKSFCREGASSAIKGMFRGLENVRVGKLVPASNYYSMRVVAFDGSIWSADNVSVGQSYSFTTGQAIIKGLLRQLTCVHSVSSSSKLFCIRLLFTGQKHEDWRILAEEEIACDEIGCRIKIILERASDVQVKITSAYKLPEDFEVRVIEALRYVLAKVLHVSVVEHSTNGSVETELISPVRSSETRLLPPLMIDSAGGENLRRLFERYLNFVRLNASTQFVHQCSAHLRHACEASANSIEAEVIGLCVAVEGLAGLLHYERSAADSQNIRVIRETNAKWLKKRAFNTVLRERVEGLLSQLMHARVQDRVQSLVERGQLDRSCLRAWKILRNKGVHGKKSKLDRADDESIQELLDDVHKVYVCMYQITFALIGYEGAFSNYAAEGFRVDAYPLR